MDGRPTWTDCDEAGDYVVSNVLSQRDLVFRPDNIDETVPHRLRPPGQMAALTVRVRALWGTNLTQTQTTWPDGSPYCESVGFMEN